MHNKRGDTYYPDMYLLRKPNFFKLVSPFAAWLLVSRAYLPGQRCLGLVLLLSFFAFQRCEAHPREPFEVSSSTAWVGTGRGWLKLLFTITNCMVFASNGLPWTDWSYIPLTLFVNKEYKRFYKSVPLLKCHVCLKNTAGAHFSEIQHNNKFDIFCCFWKSKARAPDL